MDVVGTHFHFDNLDSFPFTQFPQYLSYFCFVFSVEYLSSVLRCKHNMIFAVPLIHAKLLLPFCIRMSS